MLLYEFGDVVLMSFPGVSCEWKLRVLCDCVHNFVPHSMQFFCPTMAWQSEVIATSVTLRKFFVDSGLSVKRLVRISNVVNQKSESLGPGVFHCVFIFTCVLCDQLLINGRRFIARGCVEPVSYRSQSFSHIVNWQGEIEVGNVATLVEVGLVVKVPLSLPGTTSSSPVDKVISIGGTLNKLVITFTGSVIWEVF